MTDRTPMFATAAVAAALLLPGAPIVAADLPQSASDPAPGPTGIRRPDERPGAGPPLFPLVFIPATLAALLTVKRWGTTDP